MGISYSVDGCVTVRDCPEVRAIIDDIPADNVAVVEQEGGMIEVVLSAYDSMSSNMIETLDESIMALGPFTDKPYWVVTEVESERYGFWVGATPELIASAESNDRVEKAVAAFRKLTNDEERRLFTAATAN